MALFRLYFTAIAGQASLFFPPNQDAPDAGKTDIDGYSLQQFASEYKESGKKKGTDSYAPPQADSR